MNFVNILFNNIILKNECLITLIATFRSMANASLIDQQPIR